MSSILTFANFDISLSHYQAFLAAKAERESKSESPDAAATSRPLPFRDSQLHQVPGGPFRYMVLGMGPMLHRLGFYGEITTKSSREHFFAASIYLGYKLPTWLWARTFDVEFRISVPRLIRLQRRVPLNSPFLNACRNGDVWKIRQHLCDGVGFVGDRAMCNGMTPLLVRFEDYPLDRADFFADLLFCPARYRRRTCRFYRLSDRGGRRSQHRRRRQSVRLPLAQISYQLPPAHAYRISLVYPYSPPWG